MSKRRRHGGVDDRFEMNWGTRLDEAHDIVIF